MKREHISIRAVIFWLAIWEIAALLLDKEIFLVSPVRALTRLGQLAATARFWLPVVSSLLRIVSGYLFALAAALILSRLAFLKPRIRELLAPLMAAVKAVPVASFVILALICFSSEYLAVFLAFLIVTPLVYSNALAGYEAQSAELAEMAHVFGITGRRKFRYIELPQIRGYVMSAAKTGIGMAWKAGIAAEVIGTPDISIGSRLYQAKVYLETPDLLAWTLAVILLSVVTEKLFIILLTKAFDALQEVPEPPKAPETNKTPEAVSVSETTGAPDAHKNSGDIGAAGDIVCEHLYKAYGDTIVYDDYSHTFFGGETSVIMGPSGSGKTTLLRIIAGLEKPESGKITGADKVSMVFQEDRLLDYLTPCGNIRVAVPSASDRDILSRLTAMGIPEGELSKPVCNWSGGMRRRAALLRALMADGILLLDEPFKGLDFEAKEKAIDLTKDMAKSRTVILVTHDRDEKERIRRT